MIEVFKTDVQDKDQAAMLVDQIHETFDHCCANFDLDDCDKILRVKGITGETDVHQIINLMKRSGCHAEVLPDDDSSFQGAYFAYEEIATLR